jgi:exodeoxyribonuclease-3
MCRLPSPLRQNAGVRIVTANVNGIRAAMRKGLDQWVATWSPDVITLQEVRAPDDQVRELVASWGADGDDWHLTHSEAEAKGRAGVAVVSRFAADRVWTGDSDPRFTGLGRWAEADFDGRDGINLTVISAYVQTGDETDDAKMAEKYRFLVSMTDRITELRDQGREVLLTGDLNVAHREVDIKNWKGNLKSAGFLPEERAYFDRLFNDLGWVDLGRLHGGEGPGPYTWWSYRGKAYDNDSGWRIDYQIASPGLAQRATSAVVDRSAGYHERWSDHSPLIVDFDL